MLVPNWDLQAAIIRKLRQDPNLLPIIEARVFDRVLEEDKDQFPYVLLGLLIRILMIMIVSIYKIFPFSWMFGQGLRLLRVENN